MKKCPNCAEDVQDTDSECTNCGTRLEQQDDKNKNILEDTSQESPKELSNELAKIEMPSNHLNGSLAKKEKLGWGWGWILLTAMIISNFIGASSLRTIAGFSIMIISTLIVLAFYFWYRQKLVEKDHNNTNISILSFKAGFFAYILALAVLFFVEPSIYRIAVEKDSQVYLTQFKQNFTQLISQETEIGKKYILSPETKEDINHNISLLEQSIEIIRKKTQAYNELFSYIEKEQTVKISNNGTNELSQYKSNILSLFKLSEDSMNSLINYYKTGDEIWYKKYTNLMSQITELEQKCEVLAKKLDF